MNRAGVRKLGRYLLSASAIGSITAVYKLVLPFYDHTSVALTFLVAVLLVARWDLASGVITSTLGFLFLNFFFIPPLHTFTIADPRNWVTLFVFLFSAVLASHLTSVARNRAVEAKRGQEEMWKLYQLSRAILGVTDLDEADVSIVYLVRKIFEVDDCALYIPGKRTDTWRRIAPQEQEVTPEAWALQGILAQVDQTGKSGKFYDGERCLVYSPLKAGKEVRGVLVVQTTQLHEGTVEAIAGLATLALERVRFLKAMSRTEALKQSDELKSAILASISHDLRTPLTSLQASIDNLLDEKMKWEPSAVHEFHSIIQEDVQRLTRLIENLLAIARMEAGRLHVAKVKTNIRNLVEETISVCSSAVRNRPIHIEVTPPEAEAIIDPALVSEILVNLLENAAKYSPEFSEVQIVALLDDDGLTCSVTDFGAGIDAIERQHIFDKFYRSPSPGTRSAPGIGMGLAVVQSLVSAHEGKIRVDSVPGKGSTFTFSLPAENSASV